MREIWKFELDSHYNTVEMPIGAEILSVHSQRDSVCIWALVNPNMEKETRYFDVFGTGHPIDVNSKIFIGTCLVNNESLVWHVFETK